MKIKKYASGGVYTPFTIPVTSTSSDTKTKSGSSGQTKNPELPFKKELVEMMNTKGLESDNAVFYKDLGAVLSRYQYADDVDIPAQFITLFAEKASSIVSSKAEYDEAWSYVKEHQTGNEIASSGRYIYAEDMSSEDRNITLITPTQYLQNPDTYKVLTNKDILLARRYDSGLAFNNSSIIEDAASSISLSDITDYWEKKTKALASQASSGTLLKDSYTADVINGALLLQKQAGKVDSKTTLANSDVQAYLMNLYESMDIDHKYYLANYLAVNHRLEANPTNIMAFMAGQISGYVENSVNYSEPSGKKGGSGSGSGSNGDNELSGTTTDNQAIRMQRGSGPQSRVKIKAKSISTSTHTDGFEAWASEYGSFRDEDGKTIGGDMSISSLMNKAVVFKATLHNLYNSAYFGIKQLDATDLSRMLWNSRSQVQTVELPAKIMSDGSVRPWFELADLLWTINRSGEELTSFQLDTYMNKLAIPRNSIKYNDATHSYELNIDTRSFLVVQAYAGTDITSLSNEELRYVNSVSKKEGEVLEDKMNSLLGYKYGENHEEDDFVIGNIYIPIDINGFSTVSGTMDLYHSKDDVSYDFGSQTQANDIYKSLQNDPNKKEITTNFSK